MDAQTRWNGEHLSELFGLRAPPSNINAEMSLLGSLLSNNKAIERCGNLEPRHFAGDGLGDVFSAIREGIRAGRTVDAVSLKGRFDDPLLASLLASMVGIINATEYAQVVRECADQRELIDIGERIVNQAFSRCLTADIAGAALRQIDDLMAGGTADRSMLLDVAMDAAIAAMERARSGATAGITTGFTCFDERLGGLEPGLVYVVAGRPAMGKSSVGHQIAVNAARAGHGVLELSLEMSATQLGRRTLSTLAGVPIQAMKSGRLSTEAAGRVVMARKEVAGLPLTIDDTAGQSPAQIAGKAREARRRHGLGLVMIDHLNLMRAEVEDAKHGGTWSTEKASATVLQMAKDCECPVLLLAQLNRGVEAREEKRPVLSDLRQAGAIEQDAYAVGFVYRPEYYLGAQPEQRGDESDAKFDVRVQGWREQSERARGTAELIWQKVRDGEPGTDYLLFDGPTATFREPPNARAY